MNANKIILNNEILIDLTQDTAIEEDVAEGKTFHKADGSVGVGVARVGAEDLNDVLTEQEELLVELKETLNDKASGSGGGAVELNIAYGDVEPEDTSKLWIKCATPKEMQLLPLSLVGANEVATTSLGWEIATLDIKLPTTIQSMTAATVGTKIYLIGGYGGSGYLATILEFDCETETRTTLNVKLPTAACGVASAIVGTNIYLFGGYSGSGYLDTILEFDTEFQTITTLGAKFPNGLTTCASVIGTKVYLFGGNTSDGGIRWTYEYDTENNELKYASPIFEKGTFGITSAAVGDKIYLFGGSNGSNKLKTIQEFDTKAQVLMTLGTELNTATSAMSSAAIGEKVYLFGGKEGSNQLKTIQEFDTKTQELIILGIELPTDRSEMASAVVGDKVYLFGGCAGSQNLNEIVVFKSITTFYLPENHALAVASLEKNFFALLPNVVMGIDKVYKGNSDNTAEPVEAYIYKNDAWTLI